MKSTIAETKDSLGGSVEPVKEKVSNLGDNRLTISCNSKERLMTLYNLERERMKKNELNEPKRPAEQIKHTNMLW